MAKELRYTITGDARDFNRTLQSIDRRLAASEHAAGRFGRGLSSTFRGVASSAGYAGAALAGGIVYEGKRAVTAFQESNKVARQTQAVLKSTGGAAHVSADNIAYLAQVLSRKTGVDDEAIQSGENLLATFTNIRNEAGVGNDVFNQTTKAALDMSVAMGTDMKTAALQLGKALNDPEAGVTKLQRSGVTFTDQQKEQIKTLQESGKTLDAQKIILAEVTKEFGGSAEAQATSTDKLKVAFGNLEEDLGSGLAPAVDAIANKLTAFAIEVEPKVIKAADRIGKVFGRKDLSLDQKFRLSAAQARKTFEPLIDEAKKSIGKMHVGDKLENAFVAAAPRIADALATAAPRAAGAFVKAFKEAGPWGKLVTVAFLASKLGAFNAAGTWAAKKLIGRLVAVFAADKTLEAAGGSLGRRAGSEASGGFLSRLKGRLPSGVGALGKAGGVLAAFKALGRTLGIAAGAAAAVELTNKLRDALTHHSQDNKKPGFKLPGFDGVGGILDQLHINPFRSARLPGSGSGGPAMASVPAAGVTTAPASSGNMASISGFAAPISSQATSRSSTSARVTGPGPIVRTETATAARRVTTRPTKLQVMIETADAIDRRQYNYEWGGGHSPSFAPAHGYGHGSGPGVGFDCSGAVSAVLHAAGLLSSPLVSGDFMSYGAPGPGTVTIYANEGHVWMTIAGRAFGTSSSNPGGGAGWFGGNSSDGYAVRHVPSLGGGVSGRGAGSARRARAAAKARRKAARARKHAAAKKAAGKYYSGQSKAHGQATAADKASITPTTSSHYDQELADLDVYDAGIDGDLDAAIASGDPAAIKAAQDAAIIGIAGRGIVLQKRLKRIKRLLRRKDLSTARRIALTQEMATIIGELKGLGQQVTTMYAPTETDTGDTGTGEDPTQQLIDAQNNLAEQVKGLTEAQTADTALRERIFGTQFGVAMAAIADMVSGQIGGNVGLGIQTPGFAGGRVRY